jgi:hypothetical protein
MTIGKKLSKFGGRFAFEFFIESMHGVIIKGLKDYLINIKAEDIPAMVREVKFPAVDHLDFSAVGDNIENVERISLERLVEFIAEARPDLMLAIQNTGEAGAQYLVKLRAHLLEKIKGVTFTPEEQMVEAYCDLCESKWPVPKKKALSLKANDCPFCHGEGKKKEETKPPVEE